MKAGHFSFSAQGTIEYLVVIAAIIVIALAVVVLFADQTGSVEGTAKTSSEIGSMVGVGGISVVEAVAGLDTNGLLVLKNSGSDPLTVNKISVDGVDHNFSEPIVFDGEKIFLLNGIDACNGTNKSYSVKVYYTSLNGVSKAADFGEIIIDCTPALAPSSSFVEETEVSTFTVVYFGNGSTGGSVPVDSNRYESSAAVTVLGNTGALTKPASSFAGWNTQADGLGTDRSPGSTFSMGSADVNLYAKWVFSCSDSLEFHSGNGSAASPYGICDWNHLNNMRRYMDSNFVLLSDLNSSTYGYAGIGDNWVPDGNRLSPFTGNFDGNNHTIASLKVNRPSDNNIGLFGYTTNSISNVGLIDANVIGSIRAGALVGYMSGGTISNSYSTGRVTVSTSYAGGLVGYQNSGTISGSNSTAVVTSTGAFPYGYSGGLVGFFNSGTIVNSFAAGSVSGNRYLGGLVGYMSAGTISKSYSATSLSGASALGGLVGDKENGFITDTYSTGAITLTGNYAGGLVALQSNGTITNSYATGDISAAVGSDYVGGLAGNSSMEGIYNSYSTGTITNAFSSHVGGLIGAQGSTTVTNCGWYNGAGPSNAIGDPLGGVTYSEGSKSAFYSAAHGVYAAGSPTWSFGVDGNWTAREGNYPILTWQTQ